MEKTVFLFIVCLAVSISVVGQTKPDYSGKWMLDAEKSTLHPTIPIKGMTLNVVQTEKDLSVQVETEWNESAKMRVSGGNGTAIYPLNGKEIVVEKESGQGKYPVKVKGEFLPTGKLSLSSSRPGIFRGIEATTTIADVWELTDGGKALKITRKNTSPLGEILTEMIFMKR